MRFGLHVSIAGGLRKAPARAEALGCECFQMFSRSPHGGARAELDEEEAQAFRSEMKERTAGDCYIHSPYYINFASENNRIRYGSISAVRAELETADRLGARAVVTHLGSARDLGEDAGRMLIEGLVKIFEKPARAGKDAGRQAFRAQLLLEITAGAGNIMGDTFEEMREFITGAEQELGEGTLGVCFDTAHAFASGYDLSTSEAVKETLGQFDGLVGLERIKLVHLNDSAADRGSHIDRHANLGYGKIGKEGIRAILKELQRLDSDFVCETPALHEEEDMAWLKETRLAL